MSDPQSPRSSEPPEPPRPGAENRTLLYFVTGAAAGLAGAALWEAMRPTRRFAPSLLRERRDHPGIPPTVLLPGILGSRLERPDGTVAWLNLSNLVGHTELMLPATLPFEESRDDLRAFGTVGVDAIIPRLFGFTEYGDLIGLLDEAGFHRNVRRDGGRGAVYHIFSYDWRRDLVEAARNLGKYLDDLARARGDADARFNVVGHSMGGLVLRYYLRYGGAEPGGPITWAGARRIAQAILVATPSGGSIHALAAALVGEPVGMSRTTLAAKVVEHMPSIYQTMPPREAVPLVDRDGRPLDVDLHDPAAWDRFGWGPWDPATEDADDTEREKAFVSALLARGRAFHEALAAEPKSPCPVPVIAYGGDTYATLARAVAPRHRGLPPEFDAEDDAQARAIYEDGDGRVTRASALGLVHAGAARKNRLRDAAAPEISHTLFGDADHHGIYGEPTFQSALLRRLLRPLERAEGESAAS